MIFKSFFKPLVNYMGKASLAISALFVLLISCDYQGKKENKALFNKAEMAIENNPQQAFTHLQAVKTGLLSEYDYNYYTLLQIRAQDKAGVFISSDSVILKVRNYFIYKADAPKAALACFVTGIIYAGQEKNLKALYNFMQADEWAEKSDYQLLNPPHSTILYNIAWVLKAEKQYLESIAYLKKSIKYFELYDSQNSSRLYDFELIGANFQKMAEENSSQPQNIDSAKYYYEKAMKIAMLQNDSVNMARIHTNLGGLYYNFKDYTTAEKICKKAIEILPVKYDSTNLGWVYSILAGVYNKTNRVDSALHYIYKAKDLLKNTEHKYKVFLYEELYAIEENKGNHEKAEQYKQELAELKKGHEKARKTETDELKGEIKQLKSNNFSKYLQSVDENRNATQKLLTYINIFIIILIICALIGAWVLYRFLIIKKQTKYKIDTQVKSQVTIKAKKIEKQLQEEMKPLFEEKEDMKKIARNVVIKSILQRRDLNVILDLVQNEKNNYGIRNKVNYMVNSMLHKTQWDEMPPILEVNYGKLFKEMEKNFPMFTESEHRVCCLLSTQLFNDEEIAETLSMAPSLIEPIKKSVEQKLREAGYTLNHIENYAKNIAFS